MTNKLLISFFFLLLLNHIETLHAQSFQDLIPKAQKVSYYAYMLDGLNSYSMLCPKGCRMKENEVRRFFNKNKDAYKLIEIKNTGGYANTVYFINLKEQEEYTSSGLADKSKIFHEAKTLQEWINVRKKHSDFRIRNTPYNEIIGAIKKENMPVHDFWLIFPEYSEDDSFKESMLTTSTNSNDILYYLNIYNDKSGAKSFVLKNNLLGMSIPEFIKIFEDKESAKVYALQNNLAGLSIPEFIKIFEDKESAQKYALQHNLAGLSIKEYTSTFNDRAGLKDWLFRNKPNEIMFDICNYLGKDIASSYLDQFKTIDINELITYIQYTKDNTKPTNIICERIKDLSDAKPTGLWIQRVISPISHVFTLEGYIEHISNGIFYANKALPYISDTQSKTKIEKEISNAEKEISKYSTYIQNIREEYRRSMAIYNARMCLKCEINDEKTKLAYNEEADGFIEKYTRQHPGEIVMKNGDEYTFYEDSEGNWYIYGLFKDETFKSFKSLLNHFIKVCEDTYCK